VRAAVQVIGTGGKLEYAGLDESDELAVSYYLEMYATYSKLRLLKIPLDAKDFDAETLDILYAIHSKLLEIDDAKRKAKGKK
jgi:hypothetical protein